MEAPQLYIATLYLEHYHAFSHANHTLEFIVDLPLDIGPDDWIVVSHNDNILQKRAKFGTEVEPRGIVTRSGTRPEFWEARNAAGIEARRKNSRLHSVKEVMQVPGCFQYRILNSVRRNEIVLNVVSDDRTVTYLPQYRLSLHCSFDF